MKKICLALIFTACFGVFSFGQTPTPTPAEGTGNGIGNGTGSGADSRDYPPPLPRPGNSAEKLVALRILSKPRPVYTAEALANNIQGNVTLRVTFLDSGEIGSVSPVSGLPYGLTEQAIKAAKLITFEPATRDGVPYSVAKTLQYSFSSYDKYYAEDSQELATKAEILEMPAPELSAAEIKETGGKIILSVILKADGTTHLINPSSEWSKDLARKITEAVAKIKFNPALDRKKAAVGQVKEIEYVFPE